MRRTIATLLSITAIVTVLTACGGQQDMVSGTEGAVSGGAVSGQAVETKDRVYIYPCWHTDSNWYAENEDEDGITCSRLDGTKEKNITIKHFAGFNTIVDGYLYYDTDRKQDEEHSLQAIWRAPLEKDKDGYDIVVMEKAEKLAEETYTWDDEFGIGESYVSSDYLFYEKRNDRLIKMDLNTMEETVLEMPIENSYNKGVEIFGRGTRLFAESEWGGLYTMKQEEDTWHQVIDYTKYDVYESVDYIAGNEDFWFYSYLEDNSILHTIHRYDLNTGTVDVFMSSEQLNQAVTEAEGVDVNTEKVDICGVTDLFMEGERLYIQVQVNIQRKNEYQMGYLLFSQGQDESLLRYEKEVTECMRANRAVRKKENVVFYDAQCLDIVNGKAFVLCDGYEAEQQKLGCYDLETGEFKKITNKDVEFVEPHVYGEMVLTSRSFYDEELDLEWNPKKIRLKELVANNG